MNQAQKFKKTINTFITKLKSWSSGEQLKEFEKLELKINTAIQINCRGTIGIFTDSLLPFAHYILTDNEQFFLETSFAEEEEGVALQSKLKSWWPTFSNEQRTYVMKHIKLLLMLGCLVSQNEELRQIINQYRDASNPLIFE